MEKNGEELSGQEESLNSVENHVVWDFESFSSLSLSPSHILIDSKKISWVARKWGSLEENFAHTQWSSENSFSRMEKRYWIIRNSRKSDFVHSQKKCIRYFCLVIIVWIICCSASCFGIRLWGNRGNYQANQSPLSDVNLSMSIFVFIQSIFFS